MLFPSPGDLLNPGIEPAAPALAGGCFTTEPSGKPNPMLAMKKLEAQRIPYMSSELSPEPGTLAPEMFSSQDTVFSSYRTKVKG